MSKIRWLDDVAEHDYDAALRYLTLKFDAERAEDRVEKLRQTKLQHFRANDVLRAAGLAPAPKNDKGVVRDRMKIAKNTPLSPVLVVNQLVGCDIADGYHRVSAVYYEDPDEQVPARLA